VNVIQKLRGDNMNKFKKAREKTGYTQAYVANALGLSDTSTVAKWETGVALPRSLLLPKIADLYGCSVDELLGNDD
jgi:transcriptional regulator with XRE-family HTH domain